MFGVIVLGIVALMLFAVPAAAAVGLSVWMRRHERRAPLPRYAKWIAYTLIGVVGVITIGTLLGLVHWILAFNASGLSAADRQRILASGIAEAMYNGGVGVVFAVFSASWITFVGWRTSRRR